MTDAPLRFGISRAHGDANVVSASHALSAALGVAVGRPMSTRVAASYLALQDMVTSGGVELAWLPPLIAGRLLRSSTSGVMRAVTPHPHGADGHADGAPPRGASAQLVAVPIRAGCATYRSGLIVSASSTFASVKDLAGCRAAWTDRESAAGYVFPRALLRQHGIRDRDLAEELFVGSAMQACSAVADGRADVCATHLSEACVADPERAHAELAKKYTAAPWRLRVLAVTDAIPADAIVLAGHVDRETGRELSRALVGLSATATGQETLRSLFNAESLISPTPEMRARLLRAPIRSG
ncbi:MAG: PhnD/SsuA/transferrin family substrate-binding protein [Polyangiaceae bacterium]